MKDRIKKIRDDKNYTQQKFADELKIPRNNIAGYETGKRNPSDAVISLICEKFGVNEEWLRTGTGEMYKSLSREEEIAQITATLFKEEDSTFKYRLIKALCGMDEKGWDYLEKLLDEITKKD